MKVCTDACLFGAFVADQIRDQSLSRILDIGTGTGLLSLMLAQVNGTTIEAVEIDGDAARQAQANFDASPWAERLLVHQQGIQGFDPPHRYDLIISNPPFYENDLKSPDEKRNLAIHASALSFDDLSFSIAKHLSANGRAAILIPFEKHSDFERAIARHHLPIESKTFIKQTPKHNYFRVIYILSNSGSPNSNVGSITIKNPANGYTEDFQRLLNDYYL